MTRIEGRPQNPFTYSPARRVEAIKEEFAAADRQKRGQMWTAARDANQEVADSIVAVVGEYHSPTQSINLGAWYATRTLDRLTLKAEEDYLPTARLMREYLAECLTPMADRDRFRPDLLQVAHWLDRVAEKPANDHPLGTGLRIIASEMREYNGLFEVRMPEPAWKYPRFTQPQTK